MKPVAKAGREFGIKFLGKLEDLETRPQDESDLREFRETLLNWIELHTERKLFSRDMLETT
jgi:hypothetical protein